MTNNTILDELHAVRRKILAEYGGGMEEPAYLRDAQARLEASGRPTAKARTANHPTHNSGKVRRIRQKESK